MSLSISLTVASLMAAGYVLLIPFGVAWASWAFLFQVRNCSSDNPLSSKTSTDSETGPKTSSIAMEMIGGTGPTC